jgi:hypothetical protein
MPTTLETAICKGVKHAHKDYERISGGWWLQHAPESFLSTYIAKAIHKDAGFQVYLDTSLGKIAKERVENGAPKARGPLPQYMNLRPDISVWERTTGNIRAMIEVKRSFGNEPVRQDIQKIRRFVQKQHGGRAGYVLGYTITKRDNTFEKRIENWLQSDASLVLKYEDPAADSSGYFWGFALLRVSAN